jgi:hypothetical protein
MKVIVSLTSIPTRFQYLKPIVEHLKNIKGCHEVWVNIPKKYDRFPDWDGVFPYESFGDRVIINRDCVDLGPGTQAVGPIGKTDADMILYVNDDTMYKDDLLLHLFKHFQSEGSRSVWGLSGFNFETYFEGKYPRTHGESVDVLESYGACLAKTEWLNKILPEFKELYAVSWNDDMLLSNLFEKHDIKRRTCFTKECNLGQLSQLNYGFGADALHHLAAEASGTEALNHTENNKKILRDLKSIGKKYFKYEMS